MPPAPPTLQWLPPRSTPARPPSPRPLVQQLHPPASRGAAAAPRKCAALPGMPHRPGGLSMTHWRVVSCCLARLRPCMHMLWVLTSSGRTTHPTLERNTTKTVLRLCQLFHVVWPAPPPSGGPAHRCVPGKAMCRLAACTASCCCPAATRRDLPLLPLSLAAQKTLRFYTVTVVRMGGCRHAEQGRKL